MHLHAERLLPADAESRAIARRLYEGACRQPLASPFGLHDAARLASDQPFADPVSAVLSPERELVRALQRSSGTAGAGERGIGSPHADPRAIWRAFAARYPDWRGTTVAMRIDAVLADVFGIVDALAPDTADAIYDTVADALTRPDFRPRALMTRLRIETLGCAAAATDSLRPYETLQDDAWRGRVRCVYNPDASIDPEHRQFAAALTRLGEQAGTDVQSWRGYLDAHRARRTQFAALGCTTVDLVSATLNAATQSTTDIERLFEQVLEGRFDAEGAERFRAQMLTEMVRMSLDDGLVTQLRTGARGRARALALAPLLEQHGNDARLTLVLQVPALRDLDEFSALADANAAVALAAPGHALDDPAVALRFRAWMLEHPALRACAAPIDDGGGLLALPARHDLQRRLDCHVLARWVAEHRIPEADAMRIAVDLALDATRRLYRY